MTTLAPTEVGPFVDEHYRADYLRIEARSTYGNPKDQAELHAYLAGDQPSAELAPFHQTVRQHVAAGRTWRVVHAVAEPLTDYLRYELEWGYTRGLSLGEQIRICPLSAQHTDVGDLLILDRRHVLRMLYTPDNAFTGAELIDDSATAEALIIFAEDAWAAATEFTTWWAERPQYHRRKVA